MIEDFFKDECKAWQDLISAHMLQGNDVVTIDHVDHHHCFIFLKGDKNRFSHGEAQNLSVAFWHAYWEFGMNTGKW